MTPPIRRALGSSLLDLLMPQVHVANTRTLRQHSTAFNSGFFILKRHGTLDASHSRIRLKTRSFHSSTSVNMGDANPIGVKKPVLFFDIDNCLYSKSTKVHDLMAELIDKYFATHLNLSWNDAVKLHKDYYTNYGLALEGLVRHHQIDPLEYNAKVDDALPLEDVIKPNPELRKLIEDIDKDKVTVWLFTNAYVTHGKRVVRLLGIDDLFDGLTYCDYGQIPFVCKPQPEMFQKAMREAGIDRWENCYFVDDSYLNCSKAKELGWNVAHLVEEGLPSPRTPACQHQISHLRELRNTFPQFFKSTSA